jgi:hypothetical protein
MQCIMETANIEHDKSDKRWWAIKFMMKTLNAHDCDQDDMHEDVGGDDYVDRDALMMIMIVSIMMMTLMVMVIMMMMSMMMKMLYNVLTMIKILLQLKVKIM